MSHSGSPSAHPRNAKPPFSVVSVLKATDRNTRADRKHPKGGVYCMGILWIILIVVLVLALLGFFSRGYW